jgi:crotonobetainyl-CoA:carnitine CoA-transferase CaiB-like acyl-CoA transferase
MVREVDSPVGRIPVTSSPLRLSDSPSRFDPIPSLGEHTESILRDLGYSTEEIQKMRDAKVI